MKRIKLFYPVLIIAVIFIVSGCETVPKKFREEVGGIKTKVDTLESRVDSVEARQTEAERAASERTQALEEMKERKALSKTNISVKHKGAKTSERTRDIQVCLKNANFYTGEIDGIKGKKTRKAIREFQKANALTPDGVVGPKTWELLSKYKEGAGPAVAGIEEGTK